jgi:hypothetical protein
MENIVYRLSHDKWKSLMISSGFVHLSSKAHDTPLSFHGSIEKKGLLERLDKVPIAGITQMSLLPVEEELKLSWLGDKGKELEFTAEFNEERDARTVAELLATMRGLNVHERAAGKWQNMKTPGIGLLLSIACTAITHGIAQDIRSGGDLTPTGRRAWLKAIFIGIAEMLGTTGTLVVGGAISLLFAYWVYKRLRSPSMELVWR